MSGARDGRIRVVCFDLGGVVVRICRSWQEGCAAAGVPVRPGVETEEARAARRELSNRYQAGLLGCGEFFELLAASTGGTYTPEEVRLIHDAWILGEYEGVAALMDRLAASPGLELGVLSNTNHSHWEYMEAAKGGGDRFGSLARIRHLHASHLLGLVKPSPEIYREFERRAGVRGPEVLFFDDLEENVLAAREVGWHAERIDHAGDTARQIESHLGRYGVL